MRDLVAAGVARSARVVGRRGGYAIVISCGTSEMTLAAVRSPVRLFASLDTACEFMRGKLGLPAFEVDATNFERARLRKARPDRAEALRKTKTLMRQTPLL